MHNAYKILFLLPTFTFGGAERTSLNLLKGIDKNRFRICLVTSRQIFSHYQNIDIEKFIAIEDLGIDVWFSSLRRFVHDIGRVALLLKREKPDIAFGMMHYPSSLLVFAKTFLRVNVGVVASPRGPSTEYLKHFEHKFLRRKLLKWVFGLFCRYADRIVVSSTGMKEECIRDYHAIPERVEVIPNSIDINEIRKISQEGIDIEMPGDFKFIVTSGRLEREKDFAILLRAFCQVRKIEKVKLLIIGSGSERENIERLSHEIGIREDVILMGYQRNPYKYISRSDIFVHTCLFEGFANVIIEAMACGIPVIAIDCPYGPRDIIRHQENGLLVPMHDEGSLINYLIMLLRDKQLRDSIARRGFERAMDFPRYKMVKSYENIFQHIKGS